MSSFFFYNSEDDILKGLNPFWDILNYSKYLKSNLAILLILQAF